MESKKHMTGLQNKLSPEIKNKLLCNAWLSGRVVMQRTATPLTSVRFVLSLHTIINNHKVSGIESIHILREAYAEAKSYYVVFSGRMVMLCYNYQKAFYPGKIPFPASC